MPFTQELPQWVATGTKPPQSKLDTGWQIGERPPAGWWNWMLNRTFKTLEELQLESINVDQKGVANGVASLNASGKVPATQIDISAPADASTTVKGIVMLEDSVTSTSVTKAATPKSVKTAYDLASGAIPVGQKGAVNGVATLGADGKVPALQLNLPTPTDATTTEKGVVQLSNATDSTSETLAATPKSVKDAKDGLSTQIGILSGLNTEAKSNLVAAINEVFQSGNNVKANTVGALLSVDNSLPITSGSTWNDIISQIGSIETSSIIPGSVLVNTNATQRSTNSGTLVKVKETLVGQPGTYRISFKMSGQTNSVAHNAQVYVNGIPRGTLRRTNSATATVYTEDFELKANDSVQIYAKHDNANFVYISDLNIYIGLTFTQYS